MSRATLRRPTCVPWFFNSRVTRCAPYAGWAVWISVISCSSSRRRWR
jgi:hypothetical protein